MIYRSGDSFSPLASGHDPIWPSVGFCHRRLYHASTNLQHTLVPTSLPTSLDRRPWRPDQSPKDLSSSRWPSSSNNPLLPLLFPLTTVTLPANLLIISNAIKGAAIPAELPAWYTKNKAECIKRTGERWAVSDPSGLRLILLHHPTSYSGADSRLTFFMPNGTPLT